MLPTVVRLALLIAFLLTPAMPAAAADSGALDQAALLVRRGDYAAADRLYGRLADQPGSDAPRARLLQARVALADDRTADGEALLQRLFVDYPGSDQETSALFTLEQVRRAAGDCAGALRALDAYQASLAGRADPLGPYTPLQRAQCAGLLADWSGERAAAEQALATQGGGPRLTRIEAYERLAEAATKQGRKQDALDAYNQALALAGTREYTAEMLFTTASIGHALGQDALAVDRFRAVVVEYAETARAPDALDALARLGLQAVVSPYQAGSVRFFAREDAAALSAFEQVDASSPDAGKAHLKHAAALVRLGRADDAASELSATAEAYSGEAGDALLQLGQTHERAAHYAEAEAAYTRLGQLAPERLPEALFHVGLTRYLRSDADGAVTAWRQALASGGSLPNPLRAEILFWNARALDAQGAGSSEARDALEQAAASAPESYYGLRAYALTALNVASARPSLSTLLRLTPAESAERDAWFQSLGTSFERVAAEVAAEPELGRAEALLQVGLRAEASWEIDAVTRRYTEARDVAHLSGLADWLSLHDLPQLALKVARAERDLVGLNTLPRALQKQVFPAGWADLVVEEADQYGLDPLLLLAVARQESSFDPRAHSQADARGLMQVIPSTARMAAERLGRSDDFTLSDLYKPSVSLEFGSWYLQRLLGDYQGQVVSSLVAYNAGPGNLSRWRDRWGDDADVLVEEIPFVETQDYVRAVYTNYLEYRLLYGGG
jgi:soluble lytic murein transglycosylase